MLGRRRHLIFGAIVLLLVGGSWTLWASNGEKVSPSPTGKETRAVTITLAPVVERSVVRKVPIVGTLYGKEEIPVSSEVGGRIIRIHHEVGETVHSGDILMEIDPREFELAVNEARRALEWELAKLGLKDPPANDKDVAVEKLPGVVRARSQFELSEQVHKRTSQLKAQKTISQDEWEKAEAELKLTQAAYEQSLLDAQTILAAVRQKQAMLESALERLSDTKMKVPTPSVPSGEGVDSFVIADRNVTEGEIVSTARGSEPAFRLVICDPLKLEAAVAERFAVELRKEQKVRIKTEATGEKVFEGEITRIYPTVDRTSRTFQVEVLVPNKNRILTPGSFARGNVITRSDEHAKTVPAEAIVRFAGVVKVFTVRDGASYSVPVKPGERLEPIAAENGGHAVWFEVTGDLQAGDQVVITGQSQLADRTPITVRETTPVPPAADSTPPVKVGSAQEGSR
jgi:RND family efflux transporter MFP subunit